MNGVSDKLLLLSERKLEPLPKKFYLPSASLVAPKLLGHLLLRRTPNGLVGGPIVETEAYVMNDPACHAFKGPTKRNQAMFGPAGFSYVYLIYGFYHCFNAVCRPSGEGEAVLVRAIEPVFGVEAMRKNRKRTELKELTSGPGKLCAAMQIDRTLDGKNLCVLGSDIFIGENPYLKDWWAMHGPMTTTTRIGLSKASDWPLRFYAETHPLVSKRERKIPTSRQQ